MSPDRDVTRIVRSWLNEDRHEDADRVLNAVLDELDATPQRRSTPWSAWRDPFMNKFVAIGLGAAAVVIALFIGAQLVGPPNVIGPPAVTPSPIETPTSSAAAAAPPSDGSVEPGTRYAVSDDFGNVTLAFPTTGWNSDSGGTYTGHSGSPEETLLWFSTSPSGTSQNTPAVFPDPCTHEGAIEFEDSLAGEAEAWASVPGTELVSGPSDVTVDGRAARSVVTVVPEDVGCENSDFWLLYDPSCGASLNCTTYATWLGETLRIWIVDLGDGSRFTIRFEVRYPDASVDLEQEIQQIVDSIQFE